MFSYLIQHPYTAFLLPSSCLDTFIKRLLKITFYFIAAVCCSWNQLQRLQTIWKHCHFLIPTVKRQQAAPVHSSVSWATSDVCHHSHEPLPLYRQPLLERLKINNLCSVATLNCSRSYSCRAGVPRGHHSVLIIFAPVFTASWTDQDLNLFSDFCSTPAALS